MDEFTSRIEELNSKFNVRNVSASQQNIALQAEACNGSVPTSLFVTGLGNGSLTGPLLPHSSSSPQLAKDSPLMDEVHGFEHFISKWSERISSTDHVLFLLQVLVIARAQRQIMLQLDNLSNLLQEYRVDNRTRQTRTYPTTTIDLDSFTLPLILTLAVGSIGLFLFKTVIPNNKWFFCYFGLMEEKVVGKFSMLYVHKFSTDDKIEQNSMFL